MRESELLEHIYSRSRDLAASFDEVVVGPGDDCAVVRSPSGDELLITVDQVVEGRHFEAGTGLDLIARKAVARSISDIAAMGGRPSWGMATAVLPEGYAESDQLFDAMASWARHWGAPLIGGDIVKAHGPLALTVTVAGRMDAGVKPMLRSGIQPGDEVWLTGPIGGSFDSGRHLTFEPRVEQGVEAAASGRVSAAIDLSDGLGRDGARCAVLSGVVVEIESSAVPLHDDVEDWKRAFGEGEDHELLLFGKADGEKVIGRARACGEGEHPGAVIVDDDGWRHDARDLGWDH
ncbi:MAG: thiamine-phosphate kinase [Planctomycetota bacterium]